MLAISDIKVSIENKNIFVKDEFIRQGDFVRTSTGGLLMYVGGFTAVFPVVVGNEKWAFRCWHANMKDMQHRCEVISKVIQDSGADYLCESSYTNEGIIVDGMIYPTTRMRWVEGVTIKDYICQNKTDKNRLLELAKKFLLLCKDMHQRSFAHGDLQHGNIIVDAYGNLHLVDYDSFFSPELSGTADIITGLIDYQHPKRQSNTIMTEKVDYFSELVIYLSILGIAERPELCELYQVADSERMLFCAEDFKDFQSSRIYSDLYVLGGDISILCIVLSEYLKCTNLSDLIPFYEKMEQISQDIDKCGKIIIKDCTKNLQLISGTTGSISWKTENVDYVEIEGCQYDANASYIYYACQASVPVTRIVNIQFFNKYQRVSHDVVIQILPPPPQPMWKQYIVQICAAIIAVIVLVVLAIYLIKMPPSIASPSPAPTPQPPITNTTEKPKQNVTSTPVSPPVVKKNTQTPTKPKSVTLDYGVWESKNGKSPNSINGQGKLVYTKSVSILGWPGKTAEVGDYIEGRFTNGKPENAWWYSKGGKKKEFLHGSSE